MFKCSCNKRPYSVCVGCKNFNRALKVGFVSSIVLAVTTVIVAVATII